MTELADDIRKLVEKGIRPVSAEEAFTGATERSTKGARSSRRVLVGAGAGTIVLAMVLIVVLVMIPSGAPGGPGSAAAAELQLLASRAIDVPSLAPGQYYYSEIERQTNEIAGQLTPGGPTVLEYLNGLQQTWVNSQGYGRMVITTNPTPQFFNNADRAAWVAAGSPPVPTPPNQLNQDVTITPTGAGGSSSTPLFQVGDLPADPIALEQVLATGRFNKDLPSGPLCSSSDCTVVSAAAALLQGPDIGATPGLRSALFDVLAHVPGVVDLGTTTDKGGQTGIGLSFTHTIPAHTESIHCATGGVIAHTNSNGAYVPSQPATVGPAIPFQVAASTTTLELVIDSDTTSVIGTQETMTPYEQPVPNVCPGQPGYGGKPQIGYSAPYYWTGVVSEGVVNSDSALPASGQ